MRILLIDDDRDDQTLFCESVRIISADIHCDVANNGKEGLAMLNGYAKLPELVFLDINMPIMDGRETLKVIKSTPRLQNLTVIIYSTSISSVEAEEYDRMGVRSITKPTTFDGLVSILRRPIEDAMRQSSFNLSDPLSKK